MPIYLSDLTVKTIALRTDIMHLRTVGGIDQQLTFDDFMKSQRTLLPKSANYTILDTDINPIIVMKHGGSNVTVTLPTLADNQNAIITVIFAETVASPGTITLDAEGSETINGEAGVVLGRLNDNVTVFATSDEWVIFYQSWPLNWRISPQTANYTVGRGDDQILCNASSGVFTITIPAASDSEQFGRRITITVLGTSSYNIDVDMTGGDLINGLYATVTLRPNDSITLLNANSNWVIV